MSIFIESSPRKVLTYGKDVCASLQHQIRPEPESCNIMTLHSRKIVIISLLVKVPTGGSRLGLG